MEKTVCITGAGSGIGRAAAIALARRGYRVGLFDRDTSGLDATRALCGDGAAIAVAVGDVTDTTKVAAGFSELADRLGSFTHLVAGAGIARYAGFEDLVAADWTDQFAVNVVGVVNAINALLPHMLAQNKGLVIAVGSRRGLEPKSTTASYSASKAAVHALIRALQAEHGATRLGFSYLAPGGTNTNLGSPKDQRFMTADTVGEAIGFMCDIYPQGWVRQMEILPLGLS